MTVSPTLIAHFEIPQFVHVVFQYIHYVFNNNHMEASTIRMILFTHVYTYFYTRMQPIFCKYIFICAHHNTVHHKTPQQ